MNLSEYGWPRPHGFTPFEHQKTTSEFLTERRKAFVFNEQGTGKTASVIWATDYLLSIGVIRRVLVVCPLSVMKAAWQEDLFKFAIHRTVSIAHGSAARRKQILKANSDYVIINFDGVDIVRKEIAAGGFDLIVIDECFVAGTLIATPTGEAPIESLRAGNEVLTTTGVERIKRLICNTSVNIITIRTSDGNETTCTADHPFFTDAGWLTAKNLVGRRLICEAELPHLSARIPEGKGAAGLVSLKGYAGRDELLSALRSETVPYTESGGGVFQQDAPRAAWEQRGTSALRGDEGTYLSNYEGQGVPAAHTRGEWNRDDVLGEPCGTFAARTLDMELPRSIGATARGLSYKLQAGLRASNAQGGAGSGWELPQYVGKESTGSEEGGEAAGTWVVSVTHHEQTSAVPVYNLEVERTPHYFANGHLVHNCTAYKNAQTSRWKTMRDLCKVVKGLWMLTGTPAAQSPVDAYGLAKLVNPKGVSPFFGQFRDAVMVKVTQFRWIPKPTADLIVHTALQPAIRFEKAQCLDLPSVTYVDRDAPLTPQQLVYYRKLKKEMLIEAAGEEVSAVNAAVKMNKLLQISGGAVYTDSGEVIEFDVSSRLNVVKEVIDEASHKVLIFVPFTHTIEILSKFLTKHGITNLVINGEVSANRRAEIVKEFQTRTNPRVLVIQPKAASHGLTLTAANTIIWYAPTTSVETYLQANARIDRPGQVNPMTVVHIRGSSTEDRIYTMLRSNVDNHNKIIDLYRQEISTDDLTV